MDVIVKTRRCIGTTTRLIEDAMRNEGIYVSPTCSGKERADKILEEKVGFKMRGLIWNIRDLRKVRANKRIKLYVDEGYFVDEIKALIEDGFNIEKIVTTERNLKDILLLKEKAYLKNANNQTDVLVPNESENISFEYECYIANKSLSIPQIKNIVYDIDQGTTIVFFKDGTKEISRLMEDDTFDKEQGVAMCIMKRMFGNRSKWKRVVDGGVEKKSKSTKNEKCDNKKSVTESTAEKPKEKSIDILDMFNEINKKGYVVDLDQNADLTFDVYVYDTDLSKAHFKCPNCENITSAVKKAYDYVMGV